ncbi:MAG: ABC transporter ATP-binding protein [Polyangiaceae bacterium]
MTAPAPPATPARATLGPANDLEKVSPLGLARHLLGRLTRESKRSGAGGAGGFAGRILFAAALSSTAGALGGLVPAAVETGVQALLGNVSRASLARILAPVLAPATTASWVYIVIAFVAILLSVFVALLSSQNSTRLTAETSSRLRAIMMRSLIESSPREIATLGESLALVPVSNIPRPPGVGPPKAAGTDTVKLTVLRDAQSAAEFVIAGLVTLPYAIVALAMLATDLIGSGSGLVALGGLVIFVLSRLASLRASKGVARATQALQATDARVFGEIGEKLTHIEDFRLAGAKDRALDEVDGALRESVVARRGFARALALSSQVTTVLGAMAPLLLLLVLSATHHAPNPGEVGKLLLAIPALVARLQAIDALRVSAIEKAFVLRSVVKVMDIEPRPDASRAHLRAADLGPGGIVLDHVTFTPAGKDKPILDDVSLEVPEGSVVGLCGPSGSGKSTILRMLLRLDDPSAGAVSVAGKDVREIVVDDLSRVFSRLGQESKLLARSIEDNVLLGAPSTTTPRREAAKRALERAQIEALATDEGIARKFSPAPPNLSGGEQRRVLFARALAQDARVLVLDEPEAGLPGGQVEAVLKAAVEASKGKTLFIATHAPDLLPSTFNVLLQGGKVVDRGTHAELLERSELYRSLFSRKAKPADEPPPPGAPPPGAPPLAPPGL